MESQKVCSICFNNIAKPKLLPGDPAFCENCIDDHMKTHVCHNNSNRPNLPTEDPAGDEIWLSRTVDLVDDKGNATQLCKIHKKVAVKKYCCDCSAPCCSVCVFMAHKDHRLSNIADAEADMRTQFMKMKTESENNIKELKKHSDFLKIQKYEMNNSCKAACDNIERQIESICRKTRKMGGEIKDDIFKLQDDENGKLTKLLDDVYKMRLEMKKWYDYSDHVLQHTSIITALDDISSEYVDIQTDFDISQFLQKPVVSHPCYANVDVDLESLKELLGQLDTKLVNHEDIFTIHFDVNQMVKTNWNYESDYVMIQGVPWCVCVKHCSSTSTLGIYTHLRKTDEETVVCCTAKSNINLVNSVNEKNSLINQNTGTIFTPDGGGYGWNKFIDWDTFADRDNGFIDDDGIFTIEITIKLDNIKRCLI